MDVTTRCLCIIADFWDTCLGAEIPNKPIVGQKGRSTQSSDVVQNCLERGGKVSIQVLVVCSDAYGV